MQSINQTDLGHYQLAESLDRVAFGLSVLHDQTERSAKEKPLLQDGIVAANQLSSLINGPQTNLSEVFTQIAKGYATTLATSLTTFKTKLEDITPVQIGRTRMTPAREDLTLIDGALHQFRAHNTTKANHSPMNYHL